MTPSSHLPKLRIALLFAVALMPAFALAQSAQVSPLPKAPPEIMSEEARDRKACAQQGLTVGQDNKLRSGVAALMSESTPGGGQMTPSERAICSLNDIPVVWAEGGRMQVIPPPGSRGGDPNMRPK